MCTFRVVRLSCASPGDWTGDSFVGGVGKHAPRTVKADFGQSNFGQSIFGHRVWPANLGQSIFGQN